MNDKLKNIVNFVHVEDQYDFNRLLNTLNNLGFIWDEGQVNEDLTVHYDDWQRYKQETILEINNGMVSLYGSVKDWNIRTMYFDVTYILKLIHSCVEVNEDIKVVDIPRKLLKTPEDIGIVACVFEDLSKFLSSHVLQMNRKFTDVNTLSIKKYAGTAEHIVKQLKMNIEVLVHEEQNAIIYRLVKA